MAEGSSGSEPEQARGPESQPQQSAVDWAKFSLRNAELLRTVGTGTFGRVMVIREKTTGEYFALKILVIDDVMRLKQVEHVKNEKAILNTVGHPFLVRLYWTNHDVKFLYMVLEFVCGGEIFSYLRSAGTFSNSATMFYAAEILSAIIYLHDMSVVYRDLKPENLLLDFQGHLKITDFGFAKVLKDRTYTMCGTPEYLAPEIIMGKGYNRAVDYWALGVLIYEMLVGTPPFYDDNPMQIYQKILSGKFDFPRESQADTQARDLVRKLLVQDRTKRLGNMKSGCDDVRGHRWFRGISWEEVAERKLQPPIAPQVTHIGDTRCYDTYEEQDWKKVPSSSAMGQEYFRDF